MSNLGKTGIARALVVCPLVAALACAQTIPPPTTTAQPMKREMRIPGQPSFSFGVVMGMVKATDDRPVGSVEILLRGQDGRRHLSITSGDGIFRIGNLAGGSYALTAMAPGLEKVEQADIRVGVGEIVIVELRMKISRTVSTLRDNWISRPIQTSELAEALPPYRELQRRALVFQDLTPEMLPPADKVAKAQPDR